jgi:hypothetical protein
MSIKNLKKELEKVQDEKQKEKIIRDYWEKKFVWCGRNLILIFLILFILAVFCWLIAILKLLLWYIF